MSNYLIEAVDPKQILSYTADGTGATATSTVDMAGFDGCLFLLLPGTITTTGTIAMQIQGCATDSATGTNITDAVNTATGVAQSDKVLAIDVYKPAYRYLSADITRAVANSVLSGVVAIRYSARNVPTTKASLAVTAVEAAPAA